MGNCVFSDELYSTTSQPNSKAVTVPKKGKPALEYAMALAGANSSP